MPGEALLRVNDARVALGGRQILRGASLEAFPGEILVLLGRNGAGKSTLVRAISGRLELDGGSVRVGGRDPRSDTSLRHLIGLVPQQLAVYDRLSAGENLEAFGRLMGLPAHEVAGRVRDVLHRVGLAERANDRVHTLSGGMKRRVNIGAALMHGPRLLILDEPTVGVDGPARAALNDLLMGLRDSGLAILLTTHNMQEAEALADRVAVMVEGDIKACGVPGELIDHYFGKRMEISVTAARPLDMTLNSKEIASLAAAGFSVNPRDKSVYGLIEMTSDELPKIFQTLLGDSPDAHEIRVRRPGLDTLLDHFPDVKDQT